MILSRTTPAGDRIIEPMVALASCSKQHRIVVAGAKGVELMLELQRRGYIRAAATANCGHPAGQYDVALVDWRRRTFKTLEVALDWLVDFLSPSGVLISGLTPKRPRPTKPFGSRWNGVALSLRGEPSMTAAAPFRRGAEK
jgi:hypothetical protein